MKFKDKVVWITGGSSGIGEALAYNFHKEGAKLILSSNEEDELKRVKSNFNNRKEDVFLLPLDLSHIDTLEAKGKEALNHFGHIDILMNNGGISQRSLVKDTSIEVYKKIMNIDYFGHVAITMAILPSMLKRKSGHIVVTSSIAGKIGIPLRSAYCSAKHALHGFFDSLRAEVWRDNIKVTIVCPSGVRSKISINALVGNGHTYGKMDDVQERGLTPEECASQIIKAVMKEKEEVVLGNDYTKYSVYIKRFFPGLFSKIIRKAKVT